MANAIDIEALQEVKEATAAEQMEYMLAVIATTQSNLNKMAELAINTRNDFATRVAPILQACRRDEEKK